MVLIPNEQEGGWTLRLRTKQGLIELLLQGDSLEVALVEAEQLYADACVAVSGKPRCQSCVHWDFVSGACSLGFPEAKRTGGKHAQDCAAYWLAT